MRKRFYLLQAQVLEQVFSRVKDDLSKMNIYLGNIMIVGELIK